MEVLILAVLLGLIPATIAKNKGKSFALWWIYGGALFIVALPHALIMKRDVGALEQKAIEEGNLRKCPHCAELIKPDAKVCKHCGREV